VGVIDLDAPASFGRYRSLHIHRGECQSLQPSEGYHAGAAHTTPQVLGVGGMGRAALTHGPSATYAVAGHRIPAGRPPARTGLAAVPKARNLGVLWALGRPVGHPHATRLPATPRGRPVGQQRPFLGLLGPAASRPGDPQPARRPDARPRAFLGVVAYSV